MLVDGPVTLRTLPSNELSNNALYDTAAMSLHATQLTAAECPSGDEKLAFCRTDGRVQLVKLELKDVGRMLVRVKPG